MLSVYAVQELDIRGLTNMQSIRTDESLGITYLNSSGPL